jgi:nicotinate-nucleotide adenylyltransferase
VDEDVPAEVRYRLVEIAVSGKEKLEVSDLEMRRAGKSYTLLTLQELYRLYPDAEISIIIGSDTLSDLPNWYHPEEVLKLASVLCVPRVGIDQNDAATAQMLRERYGASVRLLSAKADVISSTEIRKRLLAGLPVAGLLADAVEQAVYESGAYFSPEVNALQEKCREALSPKRYVHVCGTMRAAAHLAVLWRQDAMKAQIAALLHDCAKCLPPLTQEVLSGDETGIAPVHHAFAGAVVARMDYGVTDEAVLRAIRLHTTGEWGMTNFDALIYCADLIEPMRDFFGVEDYRARVSEDIDGFMRYALVRVSQLIERKGRRAHPASARAIAWYEQKGTDNK